MLARIMPFNSHVSENVIAWILFLPIRRGSYVPRSVSFLPYSGLSVRYGLSPQLRRDSLSIRQPTFKL